MSHNRILNHDPDSIHACKEDYMSQDVLCQCLFLGKDNLFIVQRVVHTICCVNGQKSFKKNVKIT